MYSIVFGELRVVKLDISFIKSLVKVGLNTTTSNITTLQKHLACRNQLYQTLSQINTTIKKEGNHTKKMSQRNEQQLEVGNAI